jgi:hypothetical protein
MVSACRCGKVARSIEEDLGHTSQTSGGYPCLLLLLILHHYGTSKSFGGYRHLALGRLPTLGVVVVFRKIE